MASLTFQVTLNECRVNSANNMRTCIHSSCWCLSFAFPGGTLPASSLLCILSEHVLCAYAHTSVGDTPESPSVHAVCWYIMEPRRPWCSVIYIFPQCCVLERFHVSTHLRCLCPRGSMAFQSVDSQRLLNHSWLMGDSFTLANTRGQTPCSCV